MTLIAAPEPRPVVDFEHLRRYTMGDEKLEREILDLFVTHTPRTLDVMRDAKSATEWRAAAHGIKGSARAVGAHLVADLAAEAEAAYPEAEEARLAQLSALDAAITAVTHFVTHLTEPAAPRTA